MIEIIRMGIYSHFTGDNWRYFDCIATAICSSDNVMHYSSMLNMRTK